MAAAGRFAIYPSSVTYAGPTTLNLTYLHRVGFDPGAVINRVELGGSVDPGAHIVARADPKAMIGTRSLSALLAVMPLATGLQLTAGGVLRYQQRDDAGIFMSTNVHVSETFATGYAMVDSLSASQDDEKGVEANVQIYITSSDGITDPITRAAGNATLSTTPAFGTEYYLGPVYTAGAAIPGIKSVQINSGLTCTPFRSSGAVFPTSVIPVRRQASIRVVCHKLTADAGASWFLRAISTSFIAYLWQATDNGIRTAAGSSAHVKIHSTDGAWRIVDTSGDGLDDALVTFEYLPKTALTTSVTSTIP
jgi:hypothetical protein